LARQKVGGASGYGTVFEITKTAAGYDPTPTTPVNLDGRNGQFSAWCRPDRRRQPLWHDKWRRSERGNQMRHGVRTGRRLRPAAVFVGTGSGKL
jgi:hypothetical protein